MNEVKGSQKQLIIPWSQEKKKGSKIKSFTSMNLIYMWTI